MPPLISIITPSLNTSATLADALESVVVQGLSDIEHFLIDARSSDRTLEIAAGFPHLKITSESDLGIYDGMNKGAERATGKWLLFLQADDWLPEGTLATYREAIINHPDAVMISGGAEAVKMSEEQWVPVWSVNDCNRKKMTLENIALGEPMINARLIRRDFFNQLGGFALEYTLASDRDLLLRAARSQGKQVEIPELTYRYRWHSGSSTMYEGNKLTTRLSSENLAIAKKYLSLQEMSQRGVFRRWHTNLTVQAAMNALEAFDLNGVFHAMREGSLINPLWPISFIVEIGRSLPGFLIRGGKTRSQLLDQAHLK